MDDNYKEEVFVGQDGQAMSITREKESNGAMRIQIRKIGKNAPKSVEQTIQYEQEGDNNEE